MKIEEKKTGGKGSVKVALNVGKKDCRGPRRRGGKAKIS